MSDLGDELRETIERAAAPVTLDELRDRDVGRARHRQRAPWRTFVAGVAAAALVVVGAVVVVNLGDDEPSTTRVAAPTVAVGDIDLAVLSTSFDSDGARGPIPTSVVDTVRAVPGVAGAQGAMQRFVDVLRTTDTFDTQLPASERSAVAISWEEGAPLSFSAGGPPQQANEIAINQSLAAQYQVGVGDDVVVRSGPATFGATVVQPDGSVRHYGPDGPGGSTARVVGVFSPAGGDVDDVNLVVMRADDLAAATNRADYDRVDIVAAHDVPIDELLDRVSASLPASVMVVPPSVVGFDEQLRAELEIQRAYHWVLSPDHDLGRSATLNPATGAGAEQNLNSYNQNLASIRQTEFRVGRVAFIDDATAVVTVRLYYSGVPTSAVPTPTTAVAERVDGEWRVSNLCAYTPSNVSCASGDEPQVSEFTAPLNGWNAVDSVPGLADAFRVLADPASTVDQRVAVVDQGTALRDAIEAGVKADGQYAGRVSFNVSGARLLDPTHAQLLYSVIADGQPRLETPYPFVGNAVLVDGTWRVASRFACGLHALATLACPAAAALPTTSTGPTTTSTTEPASTTTSTTSSTTSTTQPAPTTTTP
jgi:hypothetical protein